MPIFGQNRYRFALAAGGIVVRDDRVLLVRNLSSDGGDFWVLPGGGLEEGESLDECAEREVREETGLRVRAERLAYIEQFLEGSGQGAKLWFLCSESESSEIDFSGAGTEPIVDARFLGKNELEGRTVYPEVIRSRFWKDMATGFPDTVMLGPWDLRQKD